MWAWALMVQTEQAWEGKGDPTATFGQGTLASMGILNPNLVSRST